MTLRLHSLAAQPRSTRRRLRAPCAPCASLAQQDALARFVETRLPPDRRLLDDAHAATLLGGESAATALAERCGDCAAEVVAARCLDTALMEAVAPVDGSPGLRQVVALGYGADTRPLRLPWPQGVCFYELGPHAALAHAELSLLASAAQAPRLRRVAADAAPGVAWAPQLLAAGYMPDRPGAWALQGLHRLGSEEVAATLQEVGSLAALGSSVTGEAALPEAPLSALLAAAGFRLDAWAPLGEVAASLGRQVEAPGRVVFAATKARFTGVQEERLREQLHFHESETSEEGFEEA